MSAGADEACLAEAATPARHTPSTATHAGSTLLNKALKNASSSSAATLRAVEQEQSATDNDVSVRAQFEQQQDFISFEPSPSPPPPAAAAAGGRGTPNARGNNRRRAATESNGPAGISSASKRRRIDDNTNPVGTQRMQKRERDRSTPWCETPGVDWDSCRNATEILNKEAQAFVSYISPTLEEHNLRMWTIELIRRAIQSHYSDADVQCFGSVGTGLYLPGGDIDLVVLCPSFPAPPLKPSSSLLHRLAALLLSSNIADPKSIVVIAKARVPIVKFVTRHGGFAIDLSVNQANGVEAAVRVRKMLEQFAFRPPGYVEPGTDVSKPNKPEPKSKDQVVETDRPETIVTADLGVARSLVMLVKMFLNQRGMNEVFTGGLGSYSIICLVISFLQLHPKIQTGEINPHNNVGLLFAEFLEYYGKHFYYDVTGITLRDRGGYFIKHDKGWYRPNQPYLLSIEDPNDPSNDVSGGSHNILRVRQTLGGAFDCLAATLSHRVSHFQARKDRSVVPLSDEALPNADKARHPLSQSILGCIIGMSSAGIESRNANKELHDSGVLQDLLANDEIKGSTSRSALKKLTMSDKVKDKKERKKARTLARLERKKRKREEKAQEKAEKQRAMTTAGGKKKSSRQSSLDKGARDEIDSEGEEVSEEDDDDDDDDDDELHASINGDSDGGRGFVVDVVGERNPALSKRFAPGSALASRQNSDDEESESRYSIGSPRPSLTNDDRGQTRAASRGTNPRKVDLHHTIFVGGSSDDEDASQDDDDDDDDDYDDDVMLGGASGDVLMSTSSSSKRNKSQQKDEDVIKRKQAKADYWASKSKIDTSLADNVIDLS
ncbi:hypothetical protein OIV83_002309 [Microbotryomycetes sp. JL201]|nr:hypothetical protein OIV83_002309 [Microbotryomycetes sp. JL201]